LAPIIAKALASSRGRSSFIQNRARFHTLTGCADPMLLVLAFRSPFTQPAAAGRRR
jgi:hypothetical protein